MIAYYVYIHNIIEPRKVKFLSSAIIVLFSGVQIKLC